MKTLRNINGWKQTIKRMIGSKHLWIVGVIGCLIPMAVYAASSPSPIVNGMYHFVANTVINPDEVNANFDYFADAIGVNDGNVGVGTTSPTSLLHVYKATNGNLPLIESGNSSAGISFKGGSGNTANIYQRLSGNELYIVPASNSNVIFNTTGNVGIGTTTPASRLAVAGLPSAPPDSSGTRGTVCITNAGNMWVDEDGVGDCL